MHATSGAKKWSFGTGGRVRASPAVSADGAVVFVASEDYHLYAIDAADGRGKLGCP